MGDNLYLSKIKTNVPGLDDLFHGGLRLPDVRDKRKMDGICIVIYGKRGVSKSDLAMQIMRGVDKFFKQNFPDGMKMTPRFFSMSHRLSELKKHYSGMEILDLVDVIKAPEAASEKGTVCKLCTYFKELKSFPSMPDSPLEGCRSEIFYSCPVCKMIRHGVLVYNTRLESLHWNVGSSSDMDNYFCSMSEEAIDTHQVFDHHKGENDEDLCEKTTVQLFKDIQEEVYQSVEKLSQENEHQPFSWSSCVIESFTAFSDDDLSRLPYADLMRKLRKAAAVSILVFDERGENLHLNADIILHMTKSVDPKTSYQYQEMHVVKSDCQPHVQGWHKYRNVYGLKIIVYPSIPYLLTSRFESDNAVTRLEHENLHYPKWFLQKFQSEFARGKEDLSTGDRAQRIAERLFSRCENTRLPIPYDKQNTAYTVKIMDSESEYDKLLEQVGEQLRHDDTTVAFFLLGKTEQAFRKMIAERNYAEQYLKDVHFWETTSAYVWPEIFASVVRQYLVRWKKVSSHHHLHIIVDDFGKIGLYPLMKNEPLLPFVLANICRNASALCGWDGNRRGIRITLSMLCTSSKGSYHQTLLQLRDNQ